VSPEEDRVIVALLRNYGGLFADYGYIDESIVARDAGLTGPQTYDILTNLSQRRLLNFIPRKQVPYVRYLQRREDKEHIMLPPAVYENRLNQYRQRIHAMLDYVESNDRCRSRILLEYFGETTTHDCGQCDVCREQAGMTVTKEGQQDARQRILALLADGHRHHITELFRLSLPTEELNAALTYLVQEEKVRQEDGFIQV
jgi:ATP-dependent DNA helicase RecQ